MNNRYNERMPKTGIDQHGWASTTQTNGLITVSVNDKGTMTPLLEADGINAAWIPPFRQMADITDGNNKAGAYLASPTFGGPCTAYDIPMPCHGITANRTWEVRASRYDPNLKASYVVSKIRETALNLEYSKADILLDGHPAHYSVVIVRNKGVVDRAINIAWHNTVGEPFLEKGCLVDTCADRYATMPTEFEQTQRFRIGEEFESLSSVPGRDGKMHDARIVLGREAKTTDFLSGRVPWYAHLGWGAVLNPMKEKLYLSFFKGDEAAKDGDIALQFVNLWYQFCGRDHKKGWEDVYCLGLEPAIGAFATGLENSLNKTRVMGAKTTVTIPAQGRKTLYHGTAFLATDHQLTSGVRTVEQQDTGIRVTDFNNGSLMIAADPTFERIKEVVESIDDLTR